LLACIFVTTSNTINIYKTKTLLNI